MGMNIYTLDGKHVGKRYAAGIWCWKCRLRCEMWKPDIFICPQCNVEQDVTKIEYNPAFRELGFYKKAPVKRTGIDGANGFTWRVNDGLGKDIDEVKDSLKRRIWLVTEYKEKLRMNKFWKMFDEIIEEKAISGWFI